MSARQTPSPSTWCPTSSAPGASSARSGWTRRLRRAGDIDVEVRWRPFQLDPTIPPEGKDRKRYMLDKFGSRSASADPRRIEAIGEAVGIDFAFDAIKVSPNTLDAHRVIRWAGAAGEDVQNRLARRLFKLYFEEGANTRRPCRADRSGARERDGRGGGRDAACHRRRRRGRRDRDRDRAAHGRSRRSLLPDRRQICGDGRAGKHDTIADAIRQVAAAKARGELETAGA